MYKWNETNESYQTHFTSQMTIDTCTEI